MTDSERYTHVSYDMARRLTLAYSTSFSSASRLFSEAVRPHIFAIYAMVRIADEIVDTYAGSDTAALLDRFEADTRSARQSGYATNPVIQAFVTTATRFGIGDKLVAPFFDSMRMDLEPREYDKEEYDRYIYGSAEVIGLMCLKVFVDGDSALYERLAPGARALGSAYQKVNFLRDIKSDHDERGRVYFPDVGYASFSDAQKDAIISDITTDFTAARTAVDDLPRSSRRAVAVSFAYYRTLLKKLSAVSADELKANRIRISDPHKLALFIRSAAKGRA